MIQLISVVLFLVAWTAMQAGLELWNSDRRFKAAVCYLSAAVFLWLAMPKPVVVEFTPPAPAPQKYHL